MHQRSAATAAKNDWCSSCARAADATEADWVATAHKNQVPATRPKPDAVGPLSVDATVQPTVTYPSSTHDFAAMIMKVIAAQSIFIAENRAPSTPPAAVNARKLNPSSRTCLPTRRTNAVVVRKDDALVPKLVGAAKLPMTWQMGFLFPILTEHCRTEM
ncbi:hypothetical protein [Williamsia sp.]|uniref:hypothetical protein n=1 Tax=Williamsia sp. TaxID=1872085 RepID=UPI002F92E362